MIITTIIITTIIITFLIILSILIYNAIIYEHNEKEKWSKTIMNGCFSTFVRGLRNYDECMEYYGCKTHEELCQVLSREMEIGRKQREERKKEASKMKTKAKFYKTFSIPKNYELTNEKLFKLLFTYVKETKTVFNLGYSYGEFYTDTCKSNDYKELILDFILKDYEVCKNLIKTAKHKEDRENLKKECKHIYDTVREVLKV